MFEVEDQIRDKRTGEVTKVDDETLTVKWSDGIVRDHPLTAAQDTYEVINVLAPPPDPTDTTESSVGSLTPGTPSSDPEPPIETQSAPPI